MSEAEVRRFQQAIEQARTLPKTLLSTERKLKLFALFKHAEAPAPPTPSADANELELAKVASAPMAHFARS